MPSAGEYSGRIRINTSELRAARSQVQSFGKDIEGLKTHATGIADSFKGLVTGAIGVGAIGDIFVSAIKDATDYNGKLALLTQAYKDWGVAVPTAQIDALENSMEGQLHTHAETIDALTKLAAAHVPVKDETISLQAASDLAAKSHISLSDAMGLVMKAAMGQGRAIATLGLSLPDAAAKTKAVEADQHKLAITQENVARAQDKYNEVLAKYGPTSDKTHAAQQKLNDAWSKSIEATDKLNKAQTSLLHPMQDIGDISGKIEGRLHGMGQAAADTHPLEELGVQLHDLAEKFGQELLPYVQQFTGWAKDHMPEIQSVMQTAFTVMGTALQDVGKAFQFVSEHWGVIKPILEILLARMIAVKALNMGSEFLSWGRGLMSFTQAGGGPLTNTLLALDKLVTGGIGKGLITKNFSEGAQAAAGLGKGLQSVTGVLGTTEVAAAGAGEAIGGIEVASGAAGIGAAGLATGGIAILGAAVIGLATDAGGMRTSLKNAIWGQDYDQALANAEKGLTSMSGDVQKLATDSEKLAEIHAILGERLKAAFDSHDTSKEVAAMKELGGVTDSTGKKVQGMEDQIKNGSLSEADAFKKLAAEGDKAAQQYIADQAEATRAAQEASAREATAAQLAFNAMQKASMADKDNEIADAMSKEATLAAVYGAQSKAAIAAWEAQNPELASNLSRINQIAAGLGLSKDQVVQLGQQGVLSYRGITGSLATVITGIDAMDAATARAQYNADVLAGKFQNIAGAARAAAQAAAAIAGGYSPAGGVGSSIKSAEGRKVTSPMMSLVGEGGEPEWIIPKHKAGNFAPLLDAMLGIGSHGASVPTGGGGGQTINVYVTQSNLSAADISSSLAWSLKHGAIA